VSWHDGPSSRDDELYLQTATRRRGIQTVWWLSNNMVYVGTEMVSGFEADCWGGAVPGIGLPVKLCSRACVSLEGENALPSRAAGSPAEALL
jgi:hypothetical protein